jgi:hypothetical protein
MRQALLRLLQWWKRLRRRKTLSQVCYVSSMSEVPSRLGAKLFIVERSGVPRWAALDCPCLCGSRIDVNLMTSSYPHWRLIKYGDKVTLKPSLCQPPSRCRSHFFVTKNRINWISASLESR